MQVQSKRRDPESQPGAAAGVSPEAKTPPEPAPAKGQLIVRGAEDVRPAPGFPDDTALETWQKFFGEKRPIRAVQQHVNYLTAHQKHEQVIAMLNAAIIQGQAQPWMYEILAVTMEAAKRPQDEVDRVILSIADFGNSSYESMMYSAAYLSGFGRDQAALRMYREATRFAPDRPEPYLLSLKLAARTQNPDDILWVACGTLRNVWTDEYQNHHRQADALLAGAAEKLQKANQTDKLTELNQHASQARQRDLRVRLAWNGTADLDLSVEDPAGGLASYLTRESPGGGYLINDGFASSPENCFEEYVCPVGFSGEYVLKVHLDHGKVVGNRASITIITHQGTAEEKKLTRSVQFDSGPDQTVRITLENGRREQRRTSMLAVPQSSLRELERGVSSVSRPARRRSDPEVRQAAAEFQASRQGMLPSRTQNAGGVGFAPVVSLIPSGASLSALPVVSADRRYVRMAISPVFSQIVDVAVFSFQGSTGPANGTTGPTR